MRNGCQGWFQPVVTWRMLARNDEGATAIEYALIAGGIGVGIAAIVPTVGTALSQAFTTMAGWF